MASGVIRQHTRDLSDSIETNLLDLLLNTLILRQTVPYLPISALLNVAATSKAARNLFHNTPGVFRHVDLTGVKTAQFKIDGIDRGGETWRNVQLDENLTEDDFYSGPLRGIFYNLRRTNILQDVQTLVLDGLSVTAELVNDVLSDPKFNIRILSIREAKNLNERRLMQSLRYACRTSRPERTPRLKGIYVFGKSDTPALPVTTSAGNAMSSINRNHTSNHAPKEAMCGEGDDWYLKKGRIISKPIAEGWAETLLDCRGVIHFDAVLCTSPRHQNSLAFGKVPVSSVPSGNQNQPWSIATFALGGCATCGCAPEGFTIYGDSPAEQLPLLTPLPLHSSNVKVATRPQSPTDENTENPKFVPRCWDCIRERYCFSCDQWWCESCYHIPTGVELAAAQHIHIVDDTIGFSDHEISAMEPPKIKDPKIKRDCWECQTNCLDCIARTQLHCKACGGGYCIVHYEGSTMTLCDWCSTRGRRGMRELY
ncbi:hypothetical protein BJ170DRAFT_292517 [Xylariales sp. AK1849]|nr:hypothetical protein BJ170DRAFT_292517 [Xylariales sp. AK1849]